jgi:hypothetical protein
MEQEMPRADKNKDEYEQGEEKTANDLLALEFHFCW